MKILKIATCLLVLLTVTACTSGTQIVLLGDSNATGSEAVQEVNLAIQNAAVSNCKAISVGGYAAAAELPSDSFSGTGTLTGTVVIGVPVLVECPQGTRLLPNGTAAP